MKMKGEIKKHASAGNRTRINCLEGSYADHYTTDASTVCDISSGYNQNYDSECYVSSIG